MIKIPIFLEAKDWNEIPAATFCWDPTCFWRDNIFRPIGWHWAANDPYENIVPIFRLEEGNTIKRKPELKGFPWGKD